MPDDLAALLAHPVPTPAARIVAAALAMRHGFEVEVQLSSAMLVQMTGLADRTARRALGEAIACGAVVLHRAPGHGAPLTVSAARPAAISAAKPAAKLAAEQQSVAQQSCSTANLAADVAAPTTIEIENIGSKKEKKTAKPRSACPPDFVPSTDTLADIAQALPNVDVGRELVAFVRYYTVGKGASVRRPGWDQSFFTWCKRADEWRPSLAAGPASARPAAPAGPPLSEGMKWLYRTATGTDP
jgi:hypothetical protein